MAAATLLPTSVERWAALRTAARWEKKLAGVLTAAGVPVFLPLMTRFTTSHGKRRAARVPVFPGYLFVAEPDFLASKRLTPGTRSTVAQVLRPPPFWPRGTLAWSFQAFLVLASLRMTIAARFSQDF